MEEKYLIKPGGFREIKNKLLFRSLLIAAMSGGTGVYIANSGDGPVDYIALLVGCSVVIVIIGFSLYRSFARTRRAFESYSLSIAGNVITREQAGIPDATVYFHEITDIRRFGNGTIIIKGNYRGDIIGVPAQLERYDELLARLEEIHPVNKKAAIPLIQRYWWIFALVTISLFIALFTSTTVWVIVVSAVLLTGIMAWIFFKIQNSPHLAEKVRKRRWLYLLIIIAIIVKAVITITEYP